MVRRHRLRRLINNLLLSIVFGASVVYFTLQAVSGDYGTLAGSRYVKDIRELEAEKQTLIAERDHWVRLNKLLGSEGTAERDLLDEQARRVLGVVGKDDIVILLPPEEEKQISLSALSEGYSLGAFLP